MEINLKTQWNKLNSLFRVAIILFLFLFSQFTVIWSQTITFSENSLTIKKAFSEIEKQTDMSVDYDESVLNIHKKIELGTGNKNLDETLNQILQGTNCSYVIKNNHIVISAENKKQEKENLVVTGTITDEHGEPIIGANVMERGTTNGCISDIDGNYSLSVKGNSVLLFSYIGYISKEIAVNNQKMINVRLMEDTQKLEEVVVVGYGVQKKVNLTGAVSVVKGEEMTKRPVTNATSMLQGQVPGLRVVNGSGQSGNNKVSLRVRGQGTYSDAGSDPLVLINGVPGDLSNLDPNAIESISVLKDAASAAVYGARAANGVVLVTTKTGINKKTSISYSGNFAIYSPTRMLNVVTNSVDYMNLWNEAKANSGISSGLYPQDIIDQYKNAKPGDPEYPNYDWLGEHIHSTFSHNHNVAVSGGSDKMSYNVSMYYADENGTMDGHGYKKYNFTADLQSQITKWMKFGSYVGFMRGDRKRPYEGGTDGSFTSIFAQAPTYAPQRSDGSWVYKAYPWESNNKNVIALVGNDALRKNTSYDVNAQAWLTIDIVKGLSWHTKGAVRMIAEREKEWRPLVKLYNYHSGEYMNELDVGAKGLNSNDYHTFYTYLYSYLKYDVSTKDQNHNFGLQLGYSQETNDYDWLKGYRKDFPFPLTEIDAGSKELQEAEGNLEQWSLMGIFGRFNYNYKERYLFEANFRYDGSSRFNSDSRWGIFPSFSAAWRLSEEEFMKNIGWLSNLKIRASWGQIGNNRITDKDGYQDYYGYQATYKTYNYSFGGAQAAALAQNRIGNSRLEWESTTVTNFGVDAGFLNNRLTAELDVYNKVTDGILTTPNLHLTMGIKTPPTMNTAEVTNRGFELTVGWKDHVGDFNYAVSTNFSYNHNEVTKYLGKYEAGWVEKDGKKVWQSNIGDVSVDKDKGRIVEGHPIKEYYTLNTYSGNGTHFNSDGSVNINGGPKDGMIRTEGDMKWLNAMIDAGYKFMPNQSVGRNNIYYGDLIYADLNGDGIYGSSYDYDFQGSSAMPKFGYGINISASWKNFDLSMLWAGNGGFKLYWEEDPYNSVAIRNGFATSERVANDHYFYDPENPTDSRTNLNGYIPRLVENSKQSRQTSNYYLYNGTYMKLKNLTIGYTLPVTLTEKISAERVRVYLSGENLFTITSFPGQDPEMGATTNYPSLRQFAAGISVTF